MPKVVELAPISSFRMDFQHYKFKFQLELETQSKQRGTNLDSEPKMELPVEVEVNTPPPKGNSLTSTNPTIKKNTFEANNEFLSRNS
jgi:hypothetical protein